MPRERSMSRRDFLRQGALLTTALAAGLPEALSLLHPRAAEGAIMGIGQELRDVLNEETVNRILQEALARGGDAADLFAEQRFRTSIVLDSGKIDSVTYGYPRGGGVRVVLRNQTGYAFSDELTYNSLLDAARVASSVVETQSRANPIDVTRRTLLPPFTLLNPEPLMPEAGKLDILRRMDAAARAADPRIVSVRIEYMDDVRDVLIGTSEGIYVIRVDQRDGLQRHLQACGIGTGLHYPQPLHLQQAYAPVVPAKEPEGQQVKHDDEEQRLQRRQVRQCASSPNRDFVSATLP